MVSLMTSQPVRPVHTGLVIILNLLSIIHVGYIVYQWLYVDLPLILKGTVHVIDQERDRPRAIGYKVRGKKDHWHIPFSNKAIYRWLVTW